MLKFLLVLQIILLIISIAFLIWTRRDIARAVWWSFMVRDLLWLAVTFLQFDAFKLIHEETTILVEFVIINLLTYAIYARWRLQRNYILVRRKYQPKVEELETLRAQHGGDFWRFG
jgi:hypothetical protein